ncbi:MAG: response regulator [Bacteroidota bacterium]|nr:response regulator [Bacteroidota bacterium]
MESKLNTILLIDDDMTVNFIHSQIIEAEKITKSLLIAETAEKALEIVSGEKPDLILLDLNMPKTDGWQFLTQYRKKVPPSRRSRIIILSSSADPDDKLMAQRSPDISGFYSKPLTKETMREIYNNTRKPI